MQNLSTIHGKPVKNHWKYAFQPQSAERAERSEASEAWQCCHKRMVNSWRTHGKLIENSLKIDGKLMERSWKTQGKPMENVWEIHGKLMEISWKTHASFLDLPLDAQNCSQMFRIALRCSELCPECKNCRNLFKQILTMVAKSFELERASRSHAKTGFRREGWRIPKITFFSILGLLGFHRD